MLNEEQNGAEPQPKKPVLKWVVIVIIVLVVVGGTAFFLLLKPESNKSDGGNSTEISGDLSDLIQADFIDLSKVYSISKFRSGAGHDFSQGSGESCRSMKHYFVPQDSNAKFEAMNKNQGMPPAPDGSSNDIAIYSPVDGEITKIAKEQTPIGEQIYIKSAKEPDFDIRLFHIYLDEGIKEGTTVKAGQKIGDISQYSSTDVAITKRRLTKVTYYSYFEAMSDTLFAKYQERGIKIRDELVLTKEYRDANPLQCNGEQFAQNTDSDPNSGNYARLSGYIGQESYGPSTVGTPSAEEQSSTNSSSNLPTDTGNNTNADSGGGSGTGGGTGGGQR